MNSDDILRMAREADRWATNQTSDTYEWSVLRDERFAALVAAAEREACAKVCDELVSPSRPLRDPARSWIAGTLDCARSIRAREASND